MDYTNPEDVTALLYVTSGMSNTHTLKAYAELLKSEAWLKKEQARLADASEILRQYQHNTTQGQQDPAEPETLESIVASLVAGGIDPNWLYNGMELCDLPVIFDAVTQHERSRLEEERLFATITIMPHVKGIRNPKQVLAFPWEKEVKAKEMTVEERQKAEDIFKDFFKNGVKEK